jgi:hypothetical protein
MDTEIAKENKTQHLHENKLFFVDGLSLSLSSANKATQHLNNANKNENIDDNNTINIANNSFIGENIIENNNVNFGTVNNTDSFNVKNHNNFVRESAKLTLLSTSTFNSIATSQPPSLESDNSFHHRVDFSILNNNDEREYDYNIHEGTYVIPTKEDRLLELMDFGYRDSSFLNYSKFTGGDNDNIDFNFDNIIGNVNDNNNFNTIVKNLNDSNNQNIHTIINNIDNEYYDHYYEYNSFDNYTNEDENKYINSEIIYDALVDNEIDIISDNNVYNIDNNVKNIDNNVYTIQSSNGDKVGNDDDNNNKNNHNNNNNNSTDVKDNINDSIDVDKTNKDVNNIITDNIDVNHTNNNNNNNNNTNIITTSNYVNNTINYNLNINNNNVVDNGIVLISEDEEGFST